MSRKNDSILYTSAYVRFYPKETDDKDFAKLLKDLKIDRFFCPEVSVNIRGFNKASEGHIVIPLLNSYSELGIENKRLAQNGGLKNSNFENLEIENYKKRRDALHEYLIGHKWLALEIYFCESDRPIVSDRDLNSIQTEQNKKNMDSDIRAYKIFDGLGHKFRLQYGEHGHTIHMDISDRLILFENYVLNGKVKNTNTEKLLKNICDDLKMNLFINKGIPFKQNLFISNNKTIDPFGVEAEQYKLLNQNIGTHGHSLENKTLSDNFLLNAKKASDVLRDLAKIESAVYYVVGNNFYFGGIDKTQFQTVVYTWGDDIIDCDIDIVLPKPLKEDDSQYPFYIELKSFTAANKTPLVATRGTLPPNTKTAPPNTFKGDLSSAETTQNYLDSISSTNQKTGKLDESAKTIFVYESFLGLTQKQLEKMADTIQYSLEHGAIQGSLEVPIDYSIGPFDTLKINNLSTPLSKYIFNVKDVDFTFDTHNGLKQTLKITTGHDSIFEGKIKDKLFANTSANGFSAYSANETITYMEHNDGQSTTSNTSSDNKEVSDGGLVQETSPDTTEDASTPSGFEQ